MNEQTGIEFILTYLEARAHRAVAGAPAVATSSLWEAFEASASLRVTLAADESAAGLIARDLAQASGRAGMCVVTAGSGVANLMGTIAGAWLNAVPMVCIAIDAPAEAGHPLHCRRIRSDRVVEAITKANFRASELEELIDLLPEAFRIAESDDAGPVLIEVTATALGLRVTSQVRAAA